jgi:hypothetical protein
MFTMNKSFLASHLSFRYFFIFEFLIYFITIRLESSWACPRG